MSKISRHSLSAVINFVVTDQDIDDIMSAVLDGGITYWCCRAEVVGISRGGTLRLYDSEADSVYELTLDKFLNGVRLWIENERAFTLTDAGQLDTGDIDALAADMIIQYALFSDVIYG